MNWLKSHPVVIGRIGAVWVGTPKRGLKIPHGWTTQENQPGRVSLRTRGWKTLVRTVGKQPTGKQPIGVMGEGRGQESSNTVVGSLLLSPLMRSYTHENVDHPSFESFEHEFSFCLVREDMQPHLTTAVSPGPQLFGHVGETGNWNAPKGSDHCFEEVWGIRKRQEDQGSVQRAQSRAKTSSDSAALSSSLVAVCPFRSLLVDGQLEFDPQSHRGYTPCPSIAVPIE